MAYPCAASSFPTAILSVWAGARLYFWWETKKGNDRVDWLLEGLSHKAPEIRFSASEELRLITGEYFGYHFDLPKREREEAKERWQQWWYQSGHARLPDRR